MIAHVGGPRIDQMLEAVALASPIGARGFLVMGQIAGHGLHEAVQRLARAACAVDTAAATCTGTAFRSLVTGSAGSVMIFMMICCAVAPVCGGLPVSISYNTPASEYWSVRAVISFSAVACSGLT